MVIAILYDTISFTIRRSIWNKIYYILQYFFYYIRVYFSIFLCFFTTFSLFSSSFTTSHNSNKRVKILNISNKFSSRLKFFSCKRLYFSLDGLFTRWNFSIFSNLKVLFCFIFIFHKFSTFTTLFDTQFSPGTIVSIYVMAIWKQWF